MSENNGRNNGSGPPDLDELWKQINDRLSGLFNQNGSNNRGNFGNDNQNSPNPANNNGSKYFKRFAILCLAGWLSTGFYIVDAGQRGVVLRFGKYVETTTSGPRWRLPSPLETVEIVNVDQVRTVELGYRGNVKNKTLKEALMLTDDENIIDLQFAVQYTLKSPEDYLFNNRGVEDTVMHAAETAIREIVGKNKMDYVLYEGREQVAVSAGKLMQQILDRYKSGISISKVTMQNAQPPEQVQAAFDDAVKAGQDRERQKNEGQAYANDVIPRAKGMAARLMQEAEGYRQRLISTAEGDASRFNQIVGEYNKAPVVTRERLYIEAMQHVFNSSTKIFVDQKAGNNMLYLPLDKIMQMSATPAGNNYAPTTQSQTPTASSQTVNQDKSVANGNNNHSQPHEKSATANQAPESASTTLEQVLRSRDSSLKTRDREDR